MQGFEFSLQVPSEVTDLIPAGIWNKANLELQSAEHLVSLRAKGWAPTWLPRTDFETIDSPYASQKRRPAESCDGDPLLAHLELKHYTSKAQRDAVRAAICASPGYTLAIYLPTGSGKSLCAFLPSLLTTSPDSNELGVTVIVVPTITLALDLARRVEEDVGHAVAYRPAESSAADIKARCEAGVQGPVIVSPEAFVGGLYPALKAAAGQGFLRYLIIDEAHMVLNWGDEFRPAFLQLSAARRELLNLALQASLKPFVTLLMSATLTDYHLRWLRRLFSEEGSFMVVHAARLRPEPSFWLAKAFSESERAEWVTEAVFNLPKPLILYTTKLDDSRSWLNRLRAAGFHRVGLINGDTPDEKRAEQMAGWNADNIDIMVATSAFGLGVDKQNIRTIIHAQLPESVDRFYQDVGRSGRDGFSSVSLLVWTAADWQALAGLAAPKFITEQLGLERWRQMFRFKTLLNPERNVIKVDLDVGRTMDMQGENNRRWNLRTLLLMQRAGLIEFEAVGLEGDYQHVSVRPMPVQHTDEAVWQSAVSDVRQELINDYTRAQDLLRRLTTTRDSCFAEIFKDCYRSEAFVVPVVKACGGCPTCRTARTAPRCGKIISRCSPRKVFPSRPISSELRRFLGSGNLGFIFYPPNLSGDELVSALRPLIHWLADQGVSNFVTEHLFWDGLCEACIEGSHRIVFWHARPPSRADVTFLQTQALVVIRPESVWWPDTWSALEDPYATSVIIAPDNLKSPNHPGRLIRDVIVGRAMDLQTWENEFVA
jgi:superfamily II DNA or RNA helicase